MINFIKENIYTILKGMIVGTGAILPGVSGGVLCVAFGIYEPLMDVLSNPIKNYKKHLNLLIPFLIGWLLGFIILARIISFIFVRYEDLATILFAGLIIGTIPSLLKGNNKSYLIFIISTILCILFFKALDSMNSFNIEGNTFWYFVSGMIWGLSLIVPGLSSSSLLIIMGLYQKITIAIAQLDFIVIVPLLIGLLFVALSLSKIVTYLFNNHGQIISQVISGIMCASSICMINFNFSSIYVLLLSIILFISGFTIASKIG